MSKVFDAYAACYDLLYKDKDYRGEARYIQSLLKRFQPGASRLLELGSGTGKHAALLAAKGYRVDGVELSASMLQQAEARRGQLAGRLRFHPGDARTVRVPGRFDAVISLFHVASYQVTNTDLRNYFATARHHLRRGGIFLFDVWYGPAVLSDPPAVRVKRVSGPGLEVTRLAEPECMPNQNLVHVNYHLFIRNQRDGSVTEVKEQHHMRYLFLPELELFLEQAGFSLVHAEEWLSGRVPGPGTWGVCLAARAV